MKIVRRRLLRYLGDGHAALHVLRLFVDGGRLGLNVDVLCGILSNSVDPAWHGNSQSPKGLSSTSSPSQQCAAAWCVRVRMLQRRADLLHGAPTSPPCLRRIAMHRRAFLPSSGVARTRPLSYGFGGPWRSGWAGAGGWAGGGGGVSALARRLGGTTPLHILRMPMSRAFAQPHPTCATVPSRWLARWLADVERLLKGREAVRRAGLRAYFQVRSVGWFAALVCRERLAGGTGGRDQD